MKKFILLSSLNFLLMNNTYAEISFVDEKETKIESAKEVKEKDTKKENVEVKSDKKEKDNKVTNVNIDDKDPLKDFIDNMVQFKSLFIDDLCVDQQARGQHIGESLFEHVKKEARKMHCYEVTLNVWSGNTSAEKFYEKMGLKTKKRMMEYIL